MGDNALGKPRLVARVKGVRPAATTHHSFRGHDRKTLSEARSRLYQRRSLQVNRHFAAFFKIYKIFTILRRSNLKFLQNFVKILVILKRNSQNFQKFQNFEKCWWISENFGQFSLKIWVPSGAKVCKSCRSWKTLQNDYLVTKIGVDTAENEPRKESCGRAGVFIGDLWSLRSFLGVSTRPAILTGQTCCLKLRGYAATNFIQNDWRTFNAAVLTPPIIWVGAFSTYFEIDKMCILLYRSRSYI